MTNAPEFRQAGEHYGEEYFATQKTGRDIGAQLNRFMYEGYIKPSDCVVDFGCGGGFLLKELGVDRPLGVEINPAARRHATELGIEVYSEVAQLPDGVIDVVISCHALEHVEDPLAQIRGLSKKLKTNGKMVLVVPCDAPNLPYKNPDRDFHLFSWSANNMANLVTCAGFKVEEAREISFRWPPNWLWIHDRFGLGALRIACRLYALLPTPRRQVRVVATKI